MSVSVSVRVRVRVRANPDPNPNHACTRSARPAASQASTGVRPSALRLVPMRPSGRLVAVPGGPYASSRSSSGEGQRCSGESPCASSTVSSAAHRPSKYLAVEPLPAVTAWWRAVLPPPSPSSMSVASCWSSAQIEAGLQLAAARVSAVAPSLARRKRGSALQESSAAQHSAKPAALACIKAEVPEPSRPFASVPSCWSSLRTRSTASGESSSAESNASIFASRSALTRAVGPLTSLILGQLTTP